MPDTEILTKPRGRNTGADIVRILACFSLISVHFFLNNGFYQQTVQGGRMFIMLMMRTGFMVCVPLFILLTGYLMHNQKPEKKYYLKGVKTLTIYLLASAACIVYRVVWSHADVLTGIKGVFSYTAAPYAWYIEMYFGLFLMIPFLNLAYNGLPTKRGKQVLLATGLFLTALPVIFNVYGIFDGLQWWKNPAASTVYQQILPQWWLGIYPLTYYFIGAYIGEYGVHIKPGLNALLIVIPLLFNTLYNYWRSYGTAFIWGAWTNWGSILNVALAVQVFTLVMGRKYEKTPPLVKKALQGVSGLCLGIYLVSYIFDNKYYGILNARVPVMQDRLPYYFVIVPAVFLSSMALSLALELIYRGADFGVRKLCAAVKKRRAAG